jgi:hypothetical protein
MLEVTYCLYRSTVICDHDYFLVRHFAFLYYNLVFFIMKLKNKSNCGGTVGIRFKIVS